MSAWQTAEAASPWSWLRWVLGLALLVAIGTGVAVAGTEPLVEKTTASGLRYQMLREGKGEHPTPTSLVAVHYVGRLAKDGTVFDSSYARGEPAQFQLNQVIPGWQEGVQLMRPGGQARFYIPAALGYGEQGAGGVIPPGADLIFDVELLAVAPAPGGGMGQPR